MLKCSSADSHIWCILLWRLPRDEERSQENSISGKQWTNQEVKRELEDAKSLPGVVAKFLDVKQRIIQGDSACEVDTKIGPTYEISRFCIVDKRSLNSIQVGSPNGLNKQFDQNTRIT